MLLGTPQGREADKRARCHQRRARRRARGREARTELKQMIIGSRGWIAPLRTDCDKARGAGHRTGRAAGFLRSQQPCSSGLAGFFFFFPLVSRKSRCRGGEFPPFPPSFFFFFLAPPQSHLFGWVSSSATPRFALSSRCLFRARFFAQGSIFRSGKATFLTQELPPRCRQTSGASVRIPSASPLGTAPGSFCTAALKYVTTDRSIRFLMVTRNRGSN